MDSLKLCCTNDEIYTQNPELFKRCESKRKTVIANINRVKSSKKYNLANKQRSVVLRSNTSISSSVRTQKTLKRKKPQNEIERLQTKLQRPLNSVEIDKLYRGYRKLARCSKRRNCECYHCELLRLSPNEDSSSAGDADTSTGSEGNDYDMLLFCRYFTKSDHRRNRVHNEIPVNSSQNRDTNIQVNHNKTLSCLGYPLAYVQHRKMENERSCWSWICTALIKIRTFATTALKWIYFGFAIPVRFIACRSSQSKTHAERILPFIQAKSTFRQHDFFSDEDRLSEVTVH